MHVCCTIKKNESEPTHCWIAKFLNKIFAVGANRADEIGQIKAVLVTQGGGYKSEELGVSYGHLSESEESRLQTLLKSRCDAHLIDYVRYGSSTVSPTSPYRW